MEKKARTIDTLKTTRKIPGIVIENRKKFADVRKAILNALKTGAKTIPQIAVESQLPLPVTTFYLMSLVKFGEIVVQGLDDMDEYYFYALKTSKPWY